MNDDVTQTPDSFPARFPLKVIGRTQDEVFIEHVKALLDSRATSWEPGSLRTNPSKDNNYLALTVMVVVDNKQQMQDLYQAIKAIPDVLMCL